MKQTLFIAMLLIASPAMAVEIKAPLGLQWGQTQAEIKKLGVEFTKWGNKVYDYVECIITNPPTPLSWATNYDLTFLNGTLHNVGSVGEIKAPLGLQWGQTQAEIEKLGVKFTKCGDKDDDVVCGITNPPTPISWVVDYLLTFLNGQLHAVGIVGEIKSKGKARIDKIKGTLTTKYGKPTNDFNTVEVSLASWEYDGYIGFVASHSKEDNTHSVFIAYQSKHYRDTEKQREAEKDKPDTDGL